MYCERSGQALAEEELADSITDLIADLLYLATQQHLPVDEIVRLALHHYTAELAEADAREPAAEQGSPPPVPQGGADNIDPRTLGAEQAREIAHAIYMWFAMLPDSRTLNQRR